MFPGMSPFDADWFRPLSTNSFLGILRNVWIEENLILDEKEEYEKTKSIVEMISMFTTPEVYLKIKDMEMGNSTEANVDFKVIYNTEDFTKRLNKAKRGVVEINEQREDIKERVRRMRERRQPQSDPRIHSPVRYDDDIIMGDVGPLVEKNHESEDRIVVQIERPGKRLDRETD